MVIAQDVRTAVANKKLMFPNQPPGPNNPYINGGNVSTAVVPQPKTISIPTQPPLPPQPEPVVPPAPTQPIVTPVEEPPGTSPVPSSTDALYTPEYIRLAKERYLAGLTSPEEKERARQLRSELAGMGVLSGSAFDVEQGRRVGEYQRGAEEMGRGLEMENIQYQSPEAIRGRARELLSILLPLAQQPGASQELKDKVNSLLDLVGAPFLDEEPEPALTFPDQPPGPNNPPISTSPGETPTDYLPADLSGDLAVAEQKYDQAYEKLLDIANLHDESKDVIGGQRNPYYNEELRDELRAKAARIKELAPNINAYMQTGSGATPEEIREYIDLVNEAYAMEYKHQTGPTPYRPTLPSTTPSLPGVSGGYNPLTGTTGPNPLTGF